MEGSGSWEESRKIWWNSREVKILAPPPPKDSSSFLGWGMRIAIVQGFFFGWVGGGGGGGGLWKKHK